MVSEMRTKTILSKSKDHDAKAQPRRRLVTVADLLNTRDRPGSLARLLGSHGNRLAQRLLRSRLIQAKLTVSEPGDQFEQEAERVAEKVMRMADPEAAERATTSDEIQAPQLRRMCAQCDQEIHRQPLEEEEEESRRAPLGLQRVCNEFEESHRGKDQRGTGERRDDPEPLVNEVLSSSGRSLDPQARDFFEPRFGRDFSAVKVHTDAAAAESALAVSARAYTFGHHIVFGEGQYSPATDAGRRLLAHELTHVVQQAPQTVARKPVPGRKRSDSGSPGTIQPGQETENANAEVRMKMEGAPRSVNQLSVQPVIQREFVIRPPHPGAVGRVLTPTQMADAITFNNRVVGAAGPGVIGEIRSLLGTGAAPAVVDADFVNMIVGWQAIQGLTQDGQLGPVTAAPLFRELGAAGAGECKVKRGAGYTPSGTIPVTIAGVRSSATFRLDAEFENDPATHAFPSCCEVRQFIRWNAAAAAVFPAGGVPHAGFPAGHPVDTFIEDRDLANHRYGHRSGPFSDPQNFDQYLDATGARNQAFGHIYRGRDTPDGPTAGLAGQYRFYIKVIDVCKGGVPAGGDEMIRINW
jgi:hypothetical protein